MRAVDKITLRKWRKLDWRDPYTDLIELGKLQADFDRRGIEVMTDDLRSREVRRFLEQKQAALFAYFISHSIIKVPIGYAMAEDEDYDCVLWFKEGGTREGRSHHVPVQLKEVVPIDRNPEAAIDVELAKLEKYVTSTHTVVAVHVNQEGPCIYSSIKKPKTAVCEIWLYASMAADQSSWFLYGNLLTEPRGYDIPWPRPKARKR